MCLIPQTQHGDLRMDLFFFVETPGRIYGVGIPKECQGHTPAPEVFRREKVEHRTNGSIMKSKTILPKTPGHLHFI